jgi:hypothetical protein
MSGPFGGATVHPSFIYAAMPEGELRWFRHNGAENGDGLDVSGAWLGPRRVGSGWNALDFAFGGGGSVIYGIGPDGIMKWFEHNEFNSGSGGNTPPAWNGPRDVGRGWTELEHVFPGGNGIIYTIAGDGILRWFRHVGFETGAGLDVTGAWVGPKDVGRGWGGLRHVFATGTDGVIYTVAEDGNLHWLKHHGYRTGAGLETPGTWEGPKVVGRGFGDLRHIFPGGSGPDGVIYVITRDGTLRWFKHLGFRAGIGVDTAGAFEGPKDVGRGWAEGRHVFALMPRDPPVIK